MCACKWVMFIYCIESRAAARCKHGKLKQRDEERNTKSCTEENTCVFVACYFASCVCVCLWTSHIGGGSDCGFQNHHPVFLSPVQFARHLFGRTCFISKIFPCSSSHGRALTTINPLPYSSTQHPSRTRRRGGDWRKWSPSLSL